MISNRQLHLLLQNLYWIHWAVPLIGHDLSDFETASAETQKPLNKLLNFSRHPSNVTALNQDILVKDEKIRSIKALLEKAGQFDLNQMYPEFESNLSIANNKEDRIIYAKSVLRKFLYISPYFGKGLADSIPFNSSIGCGEDEIRVSNYHSIATKEYILNTLRCEKFIRLSGQSGYYHNNSFAEEYICLCEAVIYYFGQDFEEILLAYSISLETIQNDLGIYLNRNTNNPELLNQWGYTTKEIETLIKTGTAIQVLQNDDHFISRYLGDRPAIINEDLIRKLQPLYNDIIWKTDLSKPEAFVDLWRMGGKDQYIDTTLINSSDFIYLIEEHLKKYLKHGIIQKDLIEIFNIKNYTKLKSAYKDLKLTENRKKINLLAKEFRTT